MRDRTGHVYRGGKPEPPALLLELRKHRAGSDKQQAERAVDAAQELQGLEQRLDAVPRLHAANEPDDEPIGPTELLFDRRRSGSRAEHIGIHTVGDDRHPIGCNAKVGRIRAQRLGDRHDMIGSGQHEAFCGVGHEGQRDPAHLLLLEQQRRVQLENQRNVEISRQLPASRAEQTMTLVNEIGAELLEHQASLELEVRGIQQIAEILREAGARADRFVLQSVVQLDQRAAERHLSQGEGRVGVLADIGGENEQVVAFGSKRLYETANVGGCAFGAKNRDAEIRCQVGNTHRSTPFEMIPFISFGESPV